VKNWDNSCYPKGTYSLQRDRLRSKHFSQRRPFWNQETLKYFEKRSALDDDRFNAVIGWHIMASAFVTAHVLSCSAVSQNEDKGFCVIFSISKSKCDLDSTCHLQPSFPPHVKDIHFTLFWLSRNNVFVTFLVSLTGLFWWLWTGRIIIVIFLSALKSSFCPTKPFSWCWSVILFFRFTNKTIFFTQRPQTVNILPTVNQSVFYGKKS
jgi:hypothetical protein